MRPKGSIGLVLRRRRAVADGRRGARSRDAFGEVKRRRRTRRWRKGVGRRQFVSPPQVQAIGRQKGTRERESAHTEGGDGRERQVRGK